MPADGYGVLTYPGDLSNAQLAQVGQLCGWQDPAQRFYEIESVEIYTKGDPALDNENEQFCGFCERTTTHTHVYLKWATAEAVKAQGRAYFTLMQMRGLL